MGGTRAIPLTAALHLPSGWQGKIVPKHDQFKGAVNLNSPCKFISCLLVQVPVESALKITASKGQMGTPEKAFCHFLCWHLGGSVWFFRIQRIFLSITSLKTHNPIFQGSFLCLIYNHSMLGQNHFYLHNNLSFHYGDYDNEIISLSLKGCRNRISFSFEEICD